MEEKWSYFSLKPHLRNLRYGGYCALDPSTPPRRFYAHKIFYIALFYYYIQISQIAFNITTLDAFITFFIHQCTTQLNILRYDLENFVDGCKMKSTESKIPLMQVYDVKFRNMALHLIDKTSLACFTIILFLICILAELFLFCFYGSKLSDASEKLMDSAYFLDWVEIPMKYRRNLMLFMEMIKKPIMPTAGSIAPLSNTTFVSIVKSSYSFYAFLKNTEN
ncbi:PREDICTED: uncharacterized protein LOC106104056 [Papilio polytes]|uniref:uncharacterized protein LOC106104056 n=1 Tax=Papilio polytes TaxID=76194 RepID=UPI0006766339|nr:PREDICTED: uncharacterized protein LOC106104056 [Papilio polytes]